MTDIVVVAHSGIGEAMQSVAEIILDRAVEVTVLPVAARDDPEDATARLVDVFARWDAAEPPLVITDLPGATPHNIAEAAVARAFPGTPVLTGLNLPMLLRALNHRHRPVAELAELAAHGAHAATFVGKCDEN